MTYSITGYPYDIGDGETEDDYIDRLISESQGRMNETGVGWPGGEPDREPYDSHANVKLTEEQLVYIQESGEAISQWIRSAVQDRIEREEARDLVRQSRKDEVARQVRDGIRDRLAALRPMSAEKNAALTDGE